MEEDYFDSSKILIREIEKSIAENMIIQNHYTHKWSLCKVAYGVFYITDKEHQFFEGREEKLIGCMVFGQPVGRSAAESISSLIKFNEVFELTRLFIHDGYGRNIESYCLSKAIKKIQYQFPKIKALITYADGEQGHKGTIYQACGFYYQGNSSVALMPNFSISLTGPPNYQWIHSRTAFSKFGSHNVGRLKKTIGQTFWRKKESTKHRYVYFLGNKSEKRKYLKNIKHPFQPYPKSTHHVDEIEEVFVESNQENPFFE
jgi:hypothetical protein